MVSVYTIRLLFNNIDEGDSCQLSGFGNRVFETEHCCKPEWLSPRQRPLADRERHLRNQRLDANDGAAVLIPEPQAGKSTGFLDLYMANIRFMRQQILAEFPVLCV